MTPGMVGLAKTLQGEPFHLIASYCQRGQSEDALASLKKYQWEEKWGNTSVMYHTDFPKAPVEYVPYYLIFDHTGKLRHNHMGGPYHGGDGNRYQQLVKELLKEVPSAKK